jgi:hypothetical protein
MDKRYSIGDWVRVKKSVSFHYEQKEQKIVRVMDKQDCDEVGQIVGACYRRLGWIGRELADWEHSVPGFSYFVSSGSVLLWKVARGILNVPILGTTEDIELFNVEPNLWVHDVKNMRLPWNAKKSHRTISK